ncbi:vanadium-dependent haloperoxidase [Flavisolibacter tropicus]|uniref:Phosphoesterase PA-phosphatase n=1 Tax=Flavisolibacter tropicus TaxID=1492898 RepID=A0A172TVA0_9BACT|nr:vanadium-dependent haloperoxidase [Flavisolibacter tropicus]ANE51051.1 phosphoesterase PA-phosphatase [Flavisolibacter tropicus]
MKHVLLCCGILLGIYACTNKKTSSFNDPLVYCKTVKKLNDVVLYNNFPPMIASRNYVYANIAAYECVAAGDSSYQSLAGQIKHLPPLPKPEAGKEINFQLAALLSFIKVGNAVTFPEGVLMDYYQEMFNQAKTAGLSGEVLANTTTFSDSIVSAIMRWSKKDHYAETRSAERFTITSEEGRWVPTPPAYSQGLEPHWCEVRPMVLDSCNQFTVAGPPHFNIKDTTSPYYKQVMEVKTTGENLTAEQKHIADFFDDNPFKLEVKGHVMYSVKKFSPAGHWMNIVGIAAEKAKADFNATVAAYTESSIALFDGFIACWKTKYMTAGIRPETVINKYLDPNWAPYIQTPPFPTYVSGHSVISAASAEVMTHFFGDNFSYTDTSLNEFGIRQRSFKSFREAAMEASWSRLYGGIHYRADLEDGNTMGKQIGDYITKRIVLKKTGEQLASNALPNH